MQNWTQVSRLRLWHIAIFCATLFAAGMVIPTLTTAQSSSKEETYRQLGLFDRDLSRRADRLAEVRGIERIDLRFGLHVLACDPGLIKLAELLPHLRERAERCRTAVAIGKVCICGIGKRCCISRNLQLVRIGNRGRD